MKGMIAVLFMVNLFVGFVAVPVMAKNAKPEGRSEIVATREKCQSRRHYEEWALSPEDSNEIAALDAACEKIGETSNHATAKKEPLFKPWKEMTPEELRRMEAIVNESIERKKGEKSNNLFLSSDKFRNR